ncbi:MAG TPA: hypothetical protein VN643_21815 [Pyrinomonadaceae bacterium]|nr:hypothetical protein [Pyrinomonadaceae bacterium]
MTDPELVKQLDQADVDEKPVEAVIRLKPDKAADIVPSAERTEEITKQLLARAKKQSGKTAGQYNVFRNLGSFVVSAHPTFIRELISLPEVAAVTANQQPGSAYIEPIRGAPVADLAQPAKPSRRKSTKQASKKSTHRAKRKSRA